MVLFECFCPFFLGSQAIWYSWYILGGRVPAFLPVVEDFNSVAEGLSAWSSSCFFSRGGSFLFFFYLSPPAVGNLHVPWRATGFAVLLSGLRLLFLVGEGIWRGIQIRLFCLHRGPVPFCTPALLKPTLSSVPSTPVLPCGSGR